MKTKTALKKNMTAIYMMMATLTLSLGLTACHDDNEDLAKTTDKENAPTTVVRNSFDDLAIFQNSIVMTDENGQVKDFFYGEQLDMKNLRHLYIGVENMKEAETMFRFWFAADVDIQNNGMGLTATLTDEQGHRQGVISLTAGTEENHVAEVTASADTQLAHFDQITFLKNSAWPIRFSTTQKHYCKFDIVKNVELKGIVSELWDEDKRLNMVCIQGSGNGVKPIFCAISNHHYMNPNYKAFVKKIRNSKYCPGECSAPTAATIQRILQADWNGFTASFKEAGSGELIPGANYWYDHSHNVFIFTYNGVMDYHSGYTYGERDSDYLYPFLFRVYDVDDNAIYDGASV